MSNPDVKHLVPMVAGKEMRKARKDLRIIKTARDQKAINRAVENGFFPLMKPVIPSSEIHATVAVYQDPNTGHIEVGGDFRRGPEDYGDGNYETVVHISYYAYHFPAPFAAYLLPVGLAIGELVILEDVIDDIVGSRFQGNTYRLEKCEAIWNGRDFKLQIPDVDTSRIG
jgi:hypothetical protein